MFGFPLSLRSLPSPPDQSHFEQERFNFEFEKRLFELKRRETDLGFQERERALKRKEEEIDFEHQKREAEFEHKKEQLNLEISKLEEDLVIQQHEIETLRLEFESKKGAIAFQQQHHHHDQVHLESFLLGYPNLHIASSKCPFDGYGTGGPGCDASTQTDVPSPNHNSTLLQLPKNAQPQPPESPRSLLRKIKLLDEAITREYHNLELEEAERQDQRSSWVSSLEAFHQPLLNEQKGLIEQARVDEEAFREECRKETELELKKCKEREGDQKAGLNEDLYAKLSPLFGPINSVLGTKLSLNQIEGWLGVGRAKIVEAFGVIEACRKNSGRYGPSKTSTASTTSVSRIGFELHSHQLAKQVHISLLHFTRLLSYIFDTGDSKHDDPFNPEAQPFSCLPALSSFWKSDTDSGKAPKFTPDLKVFFSSPNISNGDWVQFHGPGTLLYRIDPGFKLTVGSLCDPKGKGSFKSINSQDPASDPGDKYNGRTCTSPYQIKFKWE